jgi:hypothetical protein
VPPERVPAVVEEILAVNHLRLTGTTVGELRLLGVTEARAEPEHDLRDPATRVPAEDEDVAAWASYPARRIRTVVSPPADVRRTASLLRRRYSGTALCVRALPDRAVLLQGPGAVVADAVTLLRSLFPERVARVDPAAPAFAGRASAPLLPPATEAVEVPGAGTPWTLERLLLEYGRATGQAVGWDGRTGWLLRQVTVGNTRPLRLPPEGVHAAVEWLVALHGFCFAEATLEPPRSIRVLRPDLDDAEWPGAPPIHPTPVPVDEIERWAAHPARSVSTTLPLAALDARRTRMCLRLLVREPDRAWVELADDAHALTLTGPAPWVADWVALVREADAAQLAARDPISPR